MPQNSFDDMLNLVQVMAWCRQARYIVVLLVIIGKLRCMHMSDVVH